MSGYLPNGQPLQPHLMMDDIVGDYKDKTVTLEDFPFFANSVKMASIHPCRHASVMKTLLDRADAALKLRRERQKAGFSSDSAQELENQIENLDISNRDATGDNSDEWEEVQHDVADQDVAIRVDQYLVVFLKVSKIIAFFFLSHRRLALTVFSSLLPVLPLALNMTSRWGCSGILNVSAVISGSEGNETLFGLSGDGFRFGAI